MAYSSFYEAYKAMHPDYNPWTKGQKQGLADAYSALNPTWTPTKDAASVTVNPVKFDPYGDVGYAAQASQNIKTVGHAQGYHDYQVGSGAQNFGYDQYGRLIDTSNNPNYNPYSQANILQRNYDNTKRGTVNNYAAQGQLYSGALKNAQADNAYNYNVADDRLKRGASDYYRGIDYSLTQTKDSADSILAALLGPAFDRFLAGQKGY